MNSIVMIEHELLGVASLEWIFGGLGFTLVQEKPGIFSEWDAPPNGTQVVVGWQVLINSPLEADWVWAWRKGSVGSDHDF